MDSSLPLLIAAPLVSVISYLLGSIPFAVIVSALMGLEDPRHFGSKNPGATNVLRSGNKKAAAFTLLGDTLKGVIAVCLTKLAISLWSLSPSLAGISALAVFIGHVYPFTLKFKGGKGVATSLGILFALEPLLGLLSLVTWVLVFYVSRYSSLSAIIAAVLAPVYYVIGGNAIWSLNLGIALCLSLISVILLWRHQTNISRLLQGKEPKVKSKRR